MKNIKIIPVFIFIAVLSFSSRFIDVMEDVSNLTNAAYAKEEVKDKAKDVEHSSKEDKTHAKEGTDEKPKPEGEHAGDMHKDEKTSAKTEEKPRTKWRDPVNEDPDYEAAKRGVFNDMAARNKKLKQKEKELAAREALLKAAEQGLERKYQELTTLRGEIEKLLKTQSEEEDARIASLVKIYEGMKPKQAARIFDTLDLDVLVSVVSSMSERKLSPILAAMNPERARTVTIMLSEQKQLPTLPAEY